MHRRVKFLILTGLFFALFFNFQTVFAYDHTVAHPNIATLAVKLYNSQNDQQITDTQLNYIAQGSSEEDMPIRWFNHFFDPVYNIGFSDYIFSSGLLPFPSAPVWLQSPFDQVDYSVGDRSWQRAIDDYARGKDEEAFIGLGHAIHLMTDMAVPAHTRDSAHPGDSYESFVKSNWNKIQPLLNYEFKEINSLEQAFKDLAMYSNNNFYSDRTINNNKYNIANIIKNDFIKNKDGLFYKYYFSEINNKQYKIFVNKNPLKWNKEEVYDLDDGLILTDYSTHLIPQAISYSSGLIKLFLTEAEAKKAELQNEKMSFWEKLKAILLDSELPARRQTVKGYIMEKTLAPAVEFGGDIMEKLEEKKEIIIEIAQQNQEPEKFEEIIPEAKAKEDKEEIESENEQVAIVTSTIIIEPSVPTIPNVFSTSTVVEPIFYGSGGSSPNNNNSPEEDVVIPEVDLYIEAPSLFLELLQNTSTSFITLNFDSSETTSLPVKFEGEINVSTFWLPLFDLTTSTSHIYETAQSGNYDFRVRVIDAVGNTSTWTRATTTVPAIEYVYNYLTGDQTEDLVILTKEGSPYIIRNGFDVLEGQTLRIEAGTVIKSIRTDNLDQSGQLSIYGNLEVFGTESEKVIFTSVHDRSFDNDKMNTLNYIGNLEEGDWGGINSGYFSNTTNIKMNNFEIRYAGKREFDEVVLAWLMSYEDRCLDLGNATIDINNGIFKNCGYFSAVSLSECTGIFKNSFLQSSSKGMEVSGDNIVLSNLKFSGFVGAPFTINSGNPVYENLIFENNRLNGILDLRLRGDVFLVETEIPYIFDWDSLCYISSLVAQPGTKVYFEMDLDNYLSIPMTFIGTAEKPIKVYLSNAYWNALRLEGANVFFQYTDFVNTSPFLSVKALNYYNVNNVADLMMIDWVRADFFGDGPWRALALDIKNGTLIMENVNFINGVVPWLSAVKLTETVAILKNVNFYNSKSNGELFYLNETNSRGVEANGGTLNMDNVNFSDLVYGVFYSSDSDYNIPIVTTTNMFESNFENVIYNFFPEDLLVFTVPEEEIVEEEG